MLKKISAIILAFLLLLSTMTVAFAEKTYDDLKASITDTYHTALSLADRESFHGACNLATAYQLQVMGIYKDGIDYADSGNLWYDYYKDISVTSGGYSVITIEGKDCLYTLIEKYGNEIYNVVYSMGTGGTSGPIHVMFIRAIIDNMVYFNDSFGCTYSGTYYPEGTCTVLTIERFIDSYRGMNGDAYGCIYFTNGNSEHFVAPSTDEYKTGDYMVTANPTLRMRESTSTDSLVLEAIPYGETIYVSEIRDSWGKTTYNGMTGWISLAYTRLLNVRENGLRIEYIEADTVSASIGDDVTWTAEAIGDDDDEIYYYAFLVIKDDEEIYDTALSTSNSITYTIEEEGTYRVLVTVVDSDKNSAEMYSDALICVDISILLKGDVDNDGTINAGDARLALRSAAGLEVLTAAESYAADFDNDGKVTAIDARHILRVSAGLEQLMW